MFKGNRKEKLNWAVISVAILFIGELLLFNSKALFFLIFTFFFLHIGRKRMPRPSGKIFFTAGLLGMVIFFFELYTFRLLLFVFLSYSVIRFFQTKQASSPIIQKSDDIPKENEIFFSEPLFKNKWFGHQKTKKEVYSWNDVNIQTWIGDTAIDLNYTILPKGESVIVIRKLFGNIEIIVPYELEVTVHHSVLFGSFSIFEHSDMKLWNETIRCQTKEYHSAVRKMKIITSVVAGHLEVKRS